MDWEKIRDIIWERDKGRCNECGIVLADISKPQDVIDDAFSNSKWPIYKIMKSCYNCNKSTPCVTYYFTIHQTYTINSIKKLDELLVKNYPFVKKVFSNSLQTEVVGNCCIHCGKYQGNYYLDEILFDLVCQEKLEEYYIETINLELDYDDIQEEPYGDIEIIRKTQKGHVHHIDKNRKNNDIDNLILLCPECHKKKHKKY